MSQFSRINGSDDLNPSSVQESSVSRNPLPNPPIIITGRCFQENEKDRACYKICEKPGDSDDECIRIAHEYIEYAAKRFTYKNINNATTNFISDRIWSKIVKILSENVRNVEYCPAIFNICANKLSRTYPQRNKNIIDLFKMEKIEQFNDQWIPLVERVYAHIISRGISDEKFKKISCDHALFYANTCGFIAMRNFLHYIGVDPYSRDVAYFHVSDILKDALNVLLKNIIKNHYSADSDIAKNIYKLVLFVNVHNAVVICKWHETYEYIKTTLLANDIWKVYEEHLPPPKIYNMAKCLAEIGFPETAVILIREYLYKLCVGERKVIENF